MECPGDACRSCGYDACSASCTCFSIACGTEYPDCQDVHCDTVLGCVATNINENGTCDGTGVCHGGVCEHM